MSYPRVGTGYDIHRLVAGRRLILGGVEIPSAVGLEGHSDADVLLHAIMDALLGAAGLPDIGHHFPNTADEYQGVSSLLLLEKVRELLDANRWIIGNIDATVVAERPKIANFITQMRQYIGQSLTVGVENIGIKATTNESLGSLGRGEGIAAMAVAIIFPR